MTTVKARRRPRTKNSEGVVATTTGPSAEHLQKRLLEESVIWTGRERLRILWYRLRLAIAEMNYATRRTVELQAPWIDDRPR